MSTHTAGKTTRRSTRRSSGQSTHETVSTPKPTATTKNQKRTHAPPYDEDRKRAAVAAMLAISREHPYSAPSIAAAQTVLGAPVPAGTLAPWVNQYREEVLSMLAPMPSTEIVIRQAQEKALADLIEIRAKAADRAKQDDKMDGAAFRDLMVGVGIAGDHIAKMVGLPAEVTTLYRKLEALAHRAGDDPLTLLADYVDEYAQDTAEPVTVNEIPQDK